MSNPLSNPALRRKLLLIPAGVGLALACAGAHRGAAAGDPTTEGQWSAPFQFPVVAIHSSLLPNGKVLAWDWDLNWPRGTGAVVWDPASGRSVNVPYSPSNFFCGGNSFLSDGRLLVSGGVNNAQGAAIFDYRTNRWIPQPNMLGARYYPTHTALPNGEMLVIAGITSRTNSAAPQVWSNGRWRNLTGAAGNISLYPFMHVAPNGKVFCAGWWQGTSYLDTAGAGSWTPIAQRNYPDREYGSSAMYDTAKIFVAGGGDPPTATAEVIDLNSPSPQWRYVDSMSVPRRHVSATILADGKVLVSGGTSGPGTNNPNTPVLPAEIWDPDTEQFTTVAGLSVQRQDHHTAILLQDGSVLTAGGEEGDRAHEDAQIYSPPYLFRGARPQISTAPTTIGYNQRFVVGTPSAATIGKVSLIALSSVTHQNNFNQRINRLTFSATATGLSVMSPANANLCPPGYYLLFILNNSGVPSVAKIVKIAGTGGGTTPPPTKGGKAK